MAKQTDFNKFLSNIEPSPTTVSYISSIQTNLREYLTNHEEYKKIHVDMFLSGSYATRMLPLFIFELFLNLNHGS